MNEDKIRWCCKQKRGIELIEINPHLSESYIKEADETLENVFPAKGKWKTITAYYACYNALYSIMMRCGVKCEIHDCSLELMELFDFRSFEREYLRKLKDDRIQAQYYLKNILLGDESKVKEFVLKCKTLLNGLDSDKIEKIRIKIRNLSQINV